MTGGVLTAGGGHGWENDLVAELGRPGSAMHVVRRCVDVADLLAVAGTGQVAVVVVAADLRRLDSEAVQRLRSARVAVVGVHPAADHRAAGRLERIGVSTAVPDDVGAGTMITAAIAAIAELGDRGPRASGAADLRTALPDPGRPPTAVAAAVEPHRGRVIAVWGPAGAPGRTTVAAGIAAETAAVGLPTLLIDADVYGGVLASAFGLLDESPGLAGACRMAANGRLDLAELARLSWQINPALRLLTGIPRADRWPELRPSSIPLVFDVARSAATVTVVDCGFALEADEEITFDTVAPRRNGATLAALGHADLVLAVGSADPPGMERLVRGLVELSEMVPDAVPRVVLNRLRKSAAGRDEAAAALSRFAGLGVLAAVPEDRAATDLAWRRGEPLLQVAPASPVRTALRELAAAVVPQGAFGQIPVAAAG